MNNIENPVVDVAANKEKGASLVEYALLVALIAVVAISAVGTLGTKVSAQYTAVGSAIK